MRPFVEAVIQRFRERTFTEDDINYVVEYMTKQIKNHRDIYERRKSTYNDKFGPRVIDFNEHDLYIKRRLKLELYIAKDIIVLRSDNRFLATLHNKIRFIVRDVPESELTRLNKQHILQFSNLFLSAGRQFINLDDLDNIEDRLNQYKFPAHKNYTQNQTHFWNVQLF